MHDLVIRAGRVVDGSGSPARTADVAVDGGVITEVGAVDQRGRRELDADGALVTPGFVDIHTHYDGQATWDVELAPSSWHGVTTAVMGNCGVGFAPVRPADHQRLIELMEGVEDIPGAALHEGLSWTWQSFPEYLDDLERHPRDIDLGAQVPHGAVRLHVMGERGAAREPATPDDIAAMADLAREAVLAGALGFTTSRTLNHRSSRGELTPTLNAEADELVGIAEALGSIGKGVLQVVSDFIDLDGEFELMHDMAARSGRPISVSVAQSPVKPDMWRTLLDRMSESTAGGVTMRGQVGARAVGLLLGFEATLNPFMWAPLWADLAALPMAERVARLRRQDVRDALLGELASDSSSSLIGGRLVGRFDLMFPLGDPPDYEPDPVDVRGGDGGRPGPDAGRGRLRPDARRRRPWPAVPAGAQLRRRHARRRARPARPSGVRRRAVRRWRPRRHDLRRQLPDDAAAVVGRDRPRDRLPIELLVHKQTRATAETVGLLDRGLLAPGHRADINVIDFDGLRLRAPEFAYDLPAGGKRLLQRADGYEHTFVAGTEVRAGGESTGATPGRLVRGAQSAS